MTSHVASATTATFDETIRGATRPVLVDFTASWCGPCQMLNPILDSVAEERAEVLEVISVDVDAEPGLAQRYDVMSMPTLIVFRDGEPIRRLVGARSKTQLLAELDDIAG